MVAIECRQWPIPASDFAPLAAAIHLVYRLTPLIGIALVPLALTYLMEPYRSLKARNELGLKREVLPGESGDAAEVIVALARQSHRNS